MKERYFGLIVLVAIAFLFAPSANAADRRFAPQRAKPKSKLRMAAPNSRVLTGKEFNSIVSRAFRGAKYSANTCGGDYEYRKTTISIPNLYFKEEPLRRLHYELTKRQKERTERTQTESSIIPSGNIWRVSKIRACVDNWESYGWQGGIANGMFKIRIQFKRFSRILTRAMEEEKIYLLGIWHDLHPWSSSYGDEMIPDYAYERLRLDILLTPQVDNNGRLSYSKVNVRWHYDRDLGFVGAGRTWLSEIEKKIIDYKNKNMQVIRQRISNEFVDNKTRNYLARALTQHVKSGSFSNRTITNVSVTNTKLLRARRTSPGAELFVYFK
jgi:hypothetical protein